MIVKVRTESPELQILRALDNRIKLPNRQYYLNLKKGYEGELLFDKRSEQLQGDFLILNDLLLKKNNTTFQIDSLIIFSDIIYLFEVKNFEGDYIYDGDRILSKSNVEIVNPLIQLSRSTSLLRQIIQSLGYNIPIESFVVFINSDFTLYQSPINKPFIFPTQLNRFFAKLNSNPSILEKKNKILANQLISLHIKDHNFSQVPAYQFEDLRKGITCLACNSFSVSIVGRRCVCLDCGNAESAVDAIIRSTKEFKLLFPSKKITTTLIKDWCKIVDSNKRISRVLEQNFETVGSRRHVYYK